MGKVKLPPRAKLPDTKAPATLAATMTNTLASLDEDRPYWGNLARVLLDKLEPTEAETEAAAPPSCPICLDHHWVVDRTMPPGSLGYGRAKPCPCVSDDLAQRSLDRKLKLAGVPDRFANWDFASYAAHPLADQTALAFVQRWATEGDGSLLLFGPVGRGKTGLAIPAFRQRIADGKAPTHMYVRTIDLFRKLWASNRKDSDLSDAEITDAVAECSLLLLDDLGVELDRERPSEYVLQKLYEIVGDRHDRSRPTIFTTNLGLGELEKKITERTYWRIIEMCADNLYLMDGKNLRDPREMVS